MAKLKKVLIVEDDPALIDIYQTMLKNAKLQAEVVSLGKEVVKKMHAFKPGDKDMPDLVLLDLILPDMNGMEILRDIRGNEVTRHIKVFILTNQDLAEIEKQKDVKPDRLMIKANITPGELVGTITQALK